MCSTLLPVPHSLWLTLSHSPANLRWGNWVRFKNGAIFSKICSMITCIKLVKIGAYIISHSFLYLRPDFRWGNCLSLTLNERELASLLSYGLLGIISLSGLPPVKKNTKKHARRHACLFVVFGPDDVKKAPCLKVYNPQQHRESVYYSLLLTN